ncbi:hypothetical protein, partial [Eikenella corrodens]|uniref:hypothetical protein n=1 Tax=Eikenella corrodens TaxID=539 RepID=UPI00195EFE8E
AAIRRLRSCRLIFLNLWCKQRADLLQLKWSEAKFYGLNKTICLKNISFLPSYQPILKILSKKAVKLSKFG